MTDDRRMTRFQYLVLCVIERGADPLIAVEAVASVALSHPETDYDDEKRTYAEWLESWD